MYIYRKFSLTALNLVAITRDFEMNRLFWSILAFAVAVLAQTQWPISSTNYTDAVQWDHYSLMVEGQRLVVWSGEFVCALDLHDHQRFIYIY